MKKYSLRQPWIHFTILLLSISSTYAQQLTPYVISSSGGFYNNASGMLSFTTGEMSAVETFTSSATILTQGFQQVWELGTSTQDDPRQYFSISINPNPSDGHFNLVMESEFNGHVQIEMVDLLGRLIMHMVFEMQGTTHVQPLDLSLMPQGMYLMTITALDKNASNSAYPIMEKIQIAR